MSELRDQHKAFAEWFLQQNPIAPNVEDMAWAAWKAALAQPETAVRPCGECILAADEVCDICGANGTCDVPPMGWRCTRSAGHDGPCATVEAPEQVDFVNRGMDRLRDVQPETAEPVAWRTFNGEGGYDYREFDEDENYDEEWRRLNPAHPDWVEPLYAHPPRDEWRLASEVPEDAMFSRGAVAAIVAGAIYDFAGFMTTRPVSVSIGASDACGPVVDLITSFAEKRGLDLEEAAVQSWNLCIERDVQPPTESLIAAKCQRIEGSGEICGLTPPCPDCGSSLIDVAEGA